MSFRIGVSIKRGWRPRLERLLTGSKVNDVWVVYYDANFERDMVVRRSLFGVALIPFELFKKSHQVVDILTPDTGLRQGMARFAEVFVKSRRTTSRARRVVSAVRTWLVKKLRYPLSSVKALMNAEFVAQLLRWSYFPDTQYWYPEEMCPRDIHEYLQQWRSRP